MRPQPFRAKRTRRPCETIQQRLRSTRGRRRLQSLIFAETLPRWRCAIEKKAFCSLAPALKIWLRLEVFPAIGGVSDAQRQRTMTYKSFEELPVWQQAADLFSHADDFLNHAPPRLRSSFKNQLERAVLSVSNNIAEGFERGTTNELLQFIYIARGSAGEVRSMLLLARRRPWAQPFTGELSSLIGLAENCSRQLRGWADSLQNSGIKGPRYLDKRTQELYEERRRAMACQKRLLETLPPDHPLRKKEPQTNNTSS
jgi:four helix bundle protein